MKLTKFQHACFTIEKDETILVVDPGTFSHDFIIPKHVNGIIITHEHPDHLDPILIQKILDANPKAVIIGHESITARYANSPTLAVHPGEHYTVGFFDLQFFGGTHATIAEDVVAPPNLGVLIDNSLYYPGDSFTIPEAEGVHVKTLALPISAPWLTFSQTRAFLAAIHPTTAIPTHDGILSDDGKNLAEAMVGGFAQKNGIAYLRLNSESVLL